MREPLAFSCSTAESSCSFLNGTRRCEKFDFLKSFEHYIKTERNARQILFRTRCSLLTSLGFLNLTMSK